MNVALFGGTFDPIHLGHIAVARAAQQRFALARVYIVPADVPPHKQSRIVTPYHHRYAMACLATQGQKDLVPSLLEAPDAEGRPRYGANYSVDTVRRFKLTLKKSDRLFFLIGIDAFLDIAKWREPESLLRECEFIVVSRPGFSLADVASALPVSMRPKDSVLKPFQKQAAAGDIVLGGATIHLLSGVEEAVSATKVRETLANGRAVARWVDSAVAEYIKKTGLYRLQNSSKSVPDLVPARLSSGAKLHVIQGGRESARSIARPQQASRRPQHEEQ